MANSLITAKSAADRTEVLECRISPAGNALIVVETDHALIHAGKMHSVSGVISSLAAGATVYFHGLTDIETVHFRAGEITVTGAPVNLSFYEGSDITANGTPVTAYNRNRGSSITPTLQVFSGPTIGGGGLGTELETGIIPVAGAGKQAGFASLFETEWVLASATSYVISITNNDSVAVDVNYNFLWYEV